MLEVKNLRKSYLIDKNHREEVLRGIDFTVDNGEFVSIVGPSGSGKSTLLNIISGLDSDYEGEILFNGVSLRKMDKDLFHHEQIGFVFQSFHLIPQLSIVENVVLAMQLDSAGKTVSNHKKATELLTQVGLGNCINKKPTQLSGGQKQRVAIARALANNPAIIIADEPTGALDSKTSAEIIQLLRGLSQKGHTVIVVTHDLTIANQSDRKISICDGKVHEITGVSSPHKSPAVLGAKKKKIRFSLFQSVSLAFKNFRTRFIRNMLVALGMCIGITAILLAMGLGNGVSNNLADMFNSQFAPTQITSFFISNTSGGIQRPTVALSTDEIERLTEMFESEGVTEIYRNTILHGVGFEYEGKSLLEGALYNVQEASYKPERYADMTVEAGNLWSGEMCTGNQAEILLPEHLAMEILGADTLTADTAQELVGKEIVMIYTNRETREVIRQNTVISGVTTSAAEGFSGSVSVSSTTMAGILSAANMLPQVLSVEGFAPTIDEAQRIIDKYAADSAWEDYAIANANTFIDTFQQFIQLIVVLVSGIAGLSLVVSGVMIAIVLYISVIERTKEIGLMRAIGYRKSYVQRLFINEASLIVVLSNIFSIGFAFLLSFVVNPILSRQLGFDAPISMGITNIVTTLVITISVGMVFALYPSMRASKLDPVVALRSE